MIAELRAGRDRAVRAARRAALNEAMQRVRALASLLHTDAWNDAIAEALDSIAGLRDEDPS